MLSAARKHERLEIRCSLPSQTLNHTSIQTLNHTSSTLPSLLVLITRAPLPPLFVSLRTPSSVPPQPSLRSPQPPPLPRLQKAEDPGTQTCFASLEYHRGFSRHYNYVLAIERNERGRKLKGPSRRCGQRREEGRQGGASSGGHQEVWVMFSPTPPQNNCPSPCLSTGPCRPSSASSVPRRASERTTPRTRSSRRGGSRSVTPTCSVVTAATARVAACGTSE